MVVRSFDGRDEEAVAEARRKWKRLKDEGRALSYWREDGRVGKGTLKKFVRTINVYNLFPKKLKRTSTQGPRVLHCDPNLPVTSWVVV